MPCVPVDRFPRPITPINFKLPFVSKHLSVTFCLHPTVTMKPPCVAAPLFLILLLPVMVAAASTARKGPLVGGWRPIKDVKDPHVQEIAKFAVTEYNAQSKAGFEFERVVSGETQVVEGTNYRLVIEVKNGSLTTRCETIVWEKPWEDFKKLTSFKPLAD